MDSTPPDARALRTTAGRQENKGESGRGESRQARAGQDELEGEDDNRVFLCGVWNFQWCFGA